MNLFLNYSHSKEQKEKQWTKLTTKHIIYSISDIAPAIFNPQKNKEMNQITTLTI
jgi:hypothetical protein